MAEIRITASCWGRHSVIKVEFLSINLVILLPPSWMVPPIRHPDSHLCHPDISYLSESVAVPMLRTWSHHHFWSGQVPKSLPLGLYLKGSFNSIWQAAQLSFLNSKSDLPSETKQDPVRLLGTETFQTVSNPGNGGLETGRKQSRNTNAATGQGPGSASRDTYNQYLWAFSAELQTPN